ncbi:hypothetical protein BVC80_1605g47 [Macleaya cordata]|uniref:Cadmium-induced protein AS8 n=1 Tax=Macleaya cordata TaxID=56857 RepID=A0A200QA68_MACCD|nr:hypothetical protein BVC80_1605g47 [Macleaya cordata]
MEERERRDIDVMKKKKEERIRKKKKWRRCGGGRRWNSGDRRWGGPSRSNSKFSNSSPITCLADTLIRLSLSRKRKRKEKQTEGSRFEAEPDGNENTVLMIIKGLFRRYERWNPVHPTSGAFWGMGVGIGCGVGWGPGFGPEVIGYVGAGCGVGFSVGITLAGVGIGLPANCLIEFPYNVLMTTRTRALELVRSNSLPAMRNITEDGWNQIRPQISGFQRDVSGRLFSSNLQHSVGQGVSLTEMRKRMTSHARSVLECVGTFRNRCLPVHKGVLLGKKGD